jgi:SPP1 gp7 family putative phage head morphogenesis protein
LVAVESDYEDAWPHLMPTVNDDLLNQAIQHQIDVQHLIATVTEDFQGTLDDADQQILEEITSREATINGNLDSKRLEWLLAAIYVANHDGHIAMNADMRQQIRDFTRYEADFQASMLEDTLPFDAQVNIPDGKALDAAVFGTPILGRYVGEWLDDFEQARYDRDEIGIRKGMVGGDDAETIAGDIEAVAMVVGERQLINLTRTLFNSAANTTRQEVADENPDLVGAVQWHATLDEVTCEICADLDGEVFDSEEDAPEEMPAHPSCRCFFALVVPSARKMGIIGLAPEDRARLNGQPSKKLRYSTWLRNQSAQVQDTSLGPARGKLFRIGKLSVGKFTDSRHRRLTLPELKSRHAAAFRRARISA